MTSARTFYIGARHVGEGQPCYVIAEVAQTHDGSLGTAHALIDAAADAGVSAVKFQTHIAGAESTALEPWRVRFSMQDETRFDYWKRMEFTAEQWGGLRDHCRARAVEFLSTPFSIEAVELLNALEVPAWKIGSGEIATTPLLEKVAAMGRPVLLSSGLSGFAELDTAVEILRRGGTPFAVLQCTTSYPTPPEQIGLNMLATLRDRYDCATGLSDHSGTIFGGLAAVTLGASFVEVHFTLSRRAFGPDVVASVTDVELRELVRGVQFIENALRNPVDKDAAAAEREPLRAMFGKSIVAARSLAPGTVLTNADLAYKKPGTGIPAAEYSRVVGRRLTRTVAENAPLSWDDLEEI